jgi:DNA polymerase-3 subunit epsilon
MDNFETAGIAQQITNLVFVDTETTGFDPVNNRVIEIGLVRVENGKVVDQYQTVINPGVPIPDESYKITGIRKKEMKIAPSLIEVKDQVLSRMRGALFVAHNAKFDFDFIEQELLRLDIQFSMPYLCTVKLSRALFPQYPRHDLTSITQRFSIPVEKRHRAFDDAYALWEFWKIIDKKIPREKLLYSAKNLLVPAKKVSIDNAFSQTSFFS